MINKGKRKTEQKRLRRTQVKKKKLKQEKNKKGEKILLETYP